MSEADKAYVRVAIYLAIGALKASTKDGDRVSEIIRQLEMSADKLTLSN